MVYMLIEATTYYTVYFICAVAGAMIYLKT